MNEKICPYPGLRPFTVEESFFFKGRDLNIRQIISKLEINKILILTGASGDGKSSLVYAGVIPNARAGFFRARYNKWVFVDFRPERNPLENLASSFATNLNIDYQNTVQEFSYGFSALVDMYKSSSYYIDEDSDEWKNATILERKKRALGAANLFILADQFEEFFTNSENFSNGKSSVNAYTTVNLLLESARIALRDNLPIYVICTLRSDFISQCITFRGLPETLGFSQFFVPRLNRNELQQVIEEPALLSGGKVSKRLKEVLINELHSGFDQLPILQHTLKQLWENASDGDEELDIMHLTKIGGLPSKYLSDDDLQKFNLWFQKLNHTQKLYLELPSSSNVLNAHANFLYDSAFEYFTSQVPWAEKTINEDEAKSIIKTSFQCLTKIDQGRAVRNRATLEEIVQIINIPHIKCETVCGVLNVFRLQGNTLLRPFINDSDIATQFLPYNAVLDITHEALIRNWEYLKRWNEEEYALLTELNEFKIHLQRWLDNKKSKFYLLASGPLSHFEEWYEQCNPNKYWLAKYDNTSLKNNEKLSIAATFVVNSQDFLAASRKHIIDFEKAKLRRRNIMLVGALVVIAILTGFTYWAMREKANAQQQRLYAEQQTDSARYQQQRAIEANKIAEQERQLAEKNAQKAVFAKLQSDSARSLAEQLRNLSEEKTILANNEAANALREKKEADQQRQNAEQQRLRAESASDTSRMFTYLAISQSLSFKALQKFDDTQVNLLLAYQSELFNNQSNGYQREASIFNAMRYAYSLYSPSNSVSLLPVNASSFCVTNDGVLILCKNGDLLKLNVQNKQITNQGNKLKSAIPVNTSFFVSPDNVVVCYDNKKLQLINLTNNKVLSLDGHTDFIRTAAMSINGASLITAGRDKTLIVWRLTNSEAVCTKVFTLDSRVTAVAFGSNTDVVIAATSNGTLVKINVADEKSEIILNQNSSITTLCSSTNNKLLAVGFANGTISLFDMPNMKQLYSISVSNSGIRQALFDQEAKTLITATDDKTIKIFDLYNIDKTPILINDFNQKIQSLFLLKNRLFGLTAENSMFYWETSIDSYHEKIKPYITRDFTPEEWKHYVGEKIPYQKTK